MLYPTRFQVRQSTVLVIVLLLMGSVLYEVTRTESAARQDAARTQDIALPAAQPVEHKVRPTVRPDYVGRSSFSAASTKRVETDGVAMTAGAAGTTGTSVRGEMKVQSRLDAGNSGNAPGRAHSATSGGYAPGSYGMGGVGAWGGVSGMARPEAAKAAAQEKKAAKAQAKAEAPKKAPAPKRPGSNGGGATAGSDGGALAGTSGEVVATLMPVGGFTTGAAAVEPGAVASVEAKGASPASSPASTPEPMSMLLMGTGLVALFGVRRRFQ
jgi:hypothetical protein